MYVPYNLTWLQQSLIKQMHEVKEKKCHALKQAFKIKTTILNPQKQ